MKDGGRRASLTCCGHAVPDVKEEKQVKGDI